jgi:hypothetical protein
MSSSFERIGVTFFTCHGYEPWFDNLVSYIYGKKDELK